MRLDRRDLLVSAVAALLNSTHPGRADTFPARPLTLIVSLAAGSSVDVILRALVTGAERRLGQPIVVENRPGAGTTLAPAQMAATAKPDGYTICQLGVPVLRAPALRKTTYDPSTDFTYIIGVVQLVFGLVVRRDAPWSTLSDLIDAARRNPGTITYGTPGVGSDTHVAMELIARQQGIRWVHVPFASGDVTALLGGHIHAVASGSVWAPQVKSGELRLLATFGARRTGYWPSVPTLTENSVEVVMEGTYGLVGPKGMDTAVVETLHDAFKAAMDQPGFAAAIANFHQEARYLSSSEFRAFALDQIEKQRRLVEELGLRLN
jgi:tripartite-type tricarboxylate transporter receptor subunit TctC